MIALDICEPDGIDSGLIGGEHTATPTVTPTTNAAPVNAEKPLTNSNGNASEIQLKQLKEVFKKVLEVAPALEETIAEIAIKTKSFTEISKADCEELTVWASEVIKGEK